jgi:predicted O-methyltransferase YrrM
MDYTKFRKQLDEVLRGEHDERFENVIKSIHCMSRPRLYALLNAIVSSMEPGEIYTEVGTYQGGSLISALLGNDAHAVGVDNFAEFSTTNSYSRTLANLVHFGVDDRVTLLNMGYAEYFASLDPETKIDVYYYDGAHGYEPQLAGMEAGWPFLKPGSVVIADDFLYPEVNRAINQFITNHAEHVKILFAIDSLNDCDETYWNGIFALRVI